jgi:uncharacterized protein YggE
MRLGVLLLFIASVAGFAQEGGLRTVPAVRAQGQSVVTVRPDQAEIDLGVVTQAATAQLAGQQNAQRLSAVLAELKKLLPAGTDIQTSNYSLNPNYRYNPQGGKPTIDGYQASNTVRITLNDLTLVSRVIDTATKAGTNSINRVQFKLKDEAQVRAQALGQAAQQARGNAEAMARAMKLTLGGVLLVEEGSPTIVQPMVMQEMAMRAKAADAPTPVEPGEIEVRATVTVTMRVVGENAQ